jgi:hypothetical protein
MKHDPVALRALADRVVAGETDREVDWLIADALGEVPEHVIQGPMGTPYGWFRREGQWSLARTKESDVYAGVESWSPKPRTASLDAAMSLVPEGWTRDVDATLPEAGIAVRLYKRGSEVIVMGDSQSEPCATVAAALRALANHAEHTADSAGKGE